MKRYSLCYSIRVLQQDADTHVKRLAQPHTLRPDLSRTQGTDGALRIRYAIAL